MDLNSDSTTKTSAAGGNWYQGDKKKIWLSETKAWEVCRISYLVVTQ